MTDRGKAEVGSAYEPDMDADRDAVLEDLRGLKGATLVEAQIGVQSVRFAFNLPGDDVRGMYLTVSGVLKFQDSNGTHDFRTDADDPDKRGNLGFANFVGRDCSAVEATPERLRVCFGEGREIAIDLLATIDACK